MTSDKLCLALAVVMAPLFLIGALKAFQAPEVKPREAFPGVKQQWQNPNDLFSVLLIVGGDIIQRAIAQLCSPYYFTPVAFSFGWVSYAVSAITSAIGDGKLMPEIDCPSIIINTKSGYARTNSSWILGRILRDWPDDLLKAPPGQREPALVVTYCVQQPKNAGRPRLDMVWWFGVFVIITQILISIIPGVRDGAWTVLVITGGGTLVCLAQSALPQWTSEKFSCRDLSEKQVQTIALTRGNGSNFVLVIKSESGGLNLEDLASARVKKHHTTLPFTLALSVVWFVVLLTAIAVQENTWYLLLVGGIGMVQNIFAAGYKRQPDALGIHLETKDCIGPKEAGVNKVFDVLKEVEQRLGGGVGLALLPTFFPGELWPNEQAWKDEVMTKLKAEKAAKSDKKNVLVAPQRSFTK